MKPGYIITGIVTACLSGMSPAAYSQDVNPTVEVSRAYRAGHVTADKPLMDMEVPDSVMRFDIDVDYTVNAAPYRGAYEFRPYILDVRPEKAENDARTFFLRLGAGYSLHPVADFVYSPKLKSGNFSVSLYGTHRSYFGKYRTISLGNPSGGRQPLSWDRSTKERYSGYDSYTSAGVSGRADWKTGCFSFDLDYTGNARKDTLMTRGFDAFRADFRVASRNPADRYFLYDIRLSYLYGEDKVRTSGPAYLTEHDFSLYATLGPVFSRESRAVVDIAAEVSDYGSWLSSGSGRFSLTPRYVLDRGRWYLDLGVEVSVLLGSDVTAWSLPGLALPTWQVNPVRMHTSRGQYVYPDIEIGFDAVKNYLNIYFKADGGDSINRYSEILGRNGTFSLLSAHSQYGLPLMDNTSERVNARLGFRGNIGSRFTYDLNGGHAIYRNFLADAMVVVSPGIFGPDAGRTGAGMPISVSPALMPAVSYTGCRFWYIDFSMGWHSEDVTADARFTYLDSDMLRRMRTGFAPAPFTADADIVYNWKKRIYAGLHCNAALARTGYVCDLYAAVPESGTTEHVMVKQSDSPVRIPGYVDLGISVEYRFNRKASFWLYGGNLLDMTIQRSPLYCESGIHFTAGITVSL